MKIVQARLNTAAKAIGVENDYRKVAIEPEITQDEKRLQILDVYKRQDKNRVSFKYLEK